MKGGRRAQEDKTPGAPRLFATKNLGFVTTTGIPSHKLAERAAACVSSSTTRHLREREVKRRGSEAERMKKQKKQQMWLREKQFKQRQASTFGSPGAEVDSPGLEIRGGPT